VTLLSHRLQQNCHPDRSVAKWRDLLFSSPLSNPEGSAALPFVIPRSGLACGKLKEEMNIDRLALSQQPVRGAPYLARFWRDVGYRGP
jgi:hypothetical protein